MQACNHADRHTYIYNITLHNITLHYITLHTKHTNQTNKQTNTHTQTNKQPYKQTNIHTDRQTYIHTCFIIHKYISNSFWWSADLKANSFPRHHQSPHPLVLRCPPGTCTHRGICDDDADARQRQAAKNVSGFGRAGATGSGQCTCNVPRRKGGNLKRISGRFATSTKTPGYLHMIGL
jgi:hypothetical protein